MRNAIPREAQAVLLFNPDDMEGLDTYIQEYEAQLNAEFHPIENDIYLKMEDTETPATKVPEEIQDTQVQVYCR